MAYSKKTWMDGDLINASDLNNIENGIENVTNQTKVVEQEFKEFEVGQKFPTGYELTVDNIKSVAATKRYYFQPIGVYVGEDYTITYDGEEFYTESRGIEVGSSVAKIGMLFEDGEFNNLEPNASEWELVSIEAGAGNDLLGTWTEKQLTAQEVYNDLKQEIANRGSGDKLLFELNRNEVNGYFCADSTIDDLEGKIFLLTIRNEASGNVNIEGSTIFKVEKYAIVKLDGFFEDKESMYSAWFKCVDAGATIFGLDLINGDFGEAPIEGVKLQMTEL